MDFVRVLVAVLLPPLGVFMQERFGKRFWLNVVLTLFGYVPGIVHAVYVILRYEPGALPDREYELPRHSHV